MTNSNTRTDLGLGRSVVPHRLSAKYDPDLHNMKPELTHLCSVSCATGLIFYLGGAYSTDPTHNPFLQYLLDNQQKCNLLIPNKALGRVKKVSKCSCHIPEDNGNAIWHLFSQQTRIGVPMFALGPEDTGVLASCFLGALWKLPTAMQARFCAVVNRLHPVQTSAKQKRELGLVPANTGFLGPCCAAEWRSRRRCRFGTGNRGFFWPFIDIWRRWWNYIQHT